ncbi:MLP-like protein 329 [Hevea brasiliensis]|uniref:MLP-like protein 329 n=1 Tax=Hevea brasiliensis TaxID=3981 RepID=UPI0025D37BA5|nr:MLP-like protein 329 [Hevea brasiliensis]
MVQADKLEADVELNAPADNFYKIFYSQAHHVPNASDSIHAVEVHEGDWETPGSAKLWKYTLEGNPEYFKEKADVDEANKTITFTAVEGHVLEQYKSYKAILRVIPTGDGGLVKICVEYEKLKADDPPPSKYLDILVSVVKDVDAHLVKA